MGGICGVLGVQGNCSKDVLRYASLKLIQVVLGVGVAFMQIMYIEDFASGAADFMIEELIEEARAAGFPPPDIDRDGLVQEMTDVYWTSAIWSIFLWATIGGYSLYLIYSLGNWLQSGVRPNSTQLVVRLHPHAVELANLEAGERIQYATPFLQGQPSVIPVELR